MQPTIFLSECRLGRKSDAQRGTPTGVTLVEWPGDVAVSAAKVDGPMLDRASRHEAKLRLTSFLCGMFDTRCAGEGDPAEPEHTGIQAWASHRLPSSGFPVPSPYADHCEIVSDALGKPILMVRGRPGPSMSFASLGRTMWGAMSRNGSSVGIDAAWSGEFGREYPVHRAFHREEFAFGLSRTRGERAEAAALLWSVKEAVVKCLGCGFHLLDPLDLSVRAWQRDHKESAFQVILVNGAGRKLGMVEDEPIAVRTFREGGVWLSVAVVEEPQPIEASGDALITGRRLG